MPTRAQIIILRHAFERFKPSNTGRLAALALEDARLVDYGLPGAAVLQIPDGAWLLWPEGTDPRSLPAPRALVVLDASWSQARRMAQRICALRSLPRVALAPVRARRRMRSSPDERGMATLEAVAAAVAVLEGEERARPLERLYVQAVLRSVGGRERLSPELMNAIGVDRDDAERVTRVAGARLRAHNAAAPSGK